MDLFRLLLRQCEPELQLITQANDACMRRVVTIIFRVTAVLPLSDTPHNPVSESLYDILPIPR